MATLLGTYTIHLRRACELGLRVMTDIERRLSLFSIPLIGDAHIGPRTLLVV